jgi:N-acetylglucosaminyldiphosphoundecaprenol N-acetyl-beta-D-mannosaminyltransferase
MQQSKLLHFPISTGSYQLFLDNIISLAQNKKSAYVCVANVHMFTEAYKDERFNQVINNASIVTPDGLPLTWGLLHFNNVVQERVAGMDLLPDLLKEMEKNNLPVYFYGGTEELLSKTHFFLKKNYPDLKLAGAYSPPFRPLTQPENDEIICNINKSAPGIVFVVLGCPKQEKWMAEMNGKINACMIGIGGALPVSIGLQKRAPKWMQRYGMEWLFRLFQEPKRLFKRYFYTNGLFFYLMTRWFIRKKIFRKHL